MARHGRWWEYVIPGWNAYRIYQDISDPGGGKYGKQPDYSESNDRVYAAWDNVQRAEANHPGNYQSKYANQINGVQSKLNDMNQKGFSYDYTKDAAYQQYKNRYTRGAELASEDATAQAQAINYAVSLKQQGADDAAKAVLEAYKVDPGILDNYTGQTPITWKDQLSGLATASGLMGSGDQAGAYSYLDILGMPQDSIDSYDTVANRAFEEYMNKKLLSKSLSASGKSSGSGRSSGSSRSTSGSSKSGSGWTNSQVLTALGKYQALSDDDPTKAIYAGILKEAGMLPRGIGTTGNRSTYSGPSAGALTNLNMGSKWTLPSTTTTTKNSNRENLATMLAKNYAKKGYSAWAIMNNMHQNGYSDAEIARALENAGVN